MKFKVKVMETYKCLRKKREWITNGKIESGGLLDSLPIFSIFEANDHRSDQFRGWWMKDFQFCVGPRPDCMHFGWIVLSILVSDDFSVCFSSCSHFFSIKKTLKRN